MKIKEMLTMAFAAVVACVSSVALAVVHVDIEHDTVGARPGYWTSDFAAAKAAAEKTHTPMLLFWGFDQCAHCGKMKSNGLDSDEFKAWIAKKPIYLVYTEVDEAHRYTDTAVKTFTKGDNKSGDYPFMRCYWLKADGTTVSRCFSGNSHQLPVDVGILSEQLTGTLDKYFGSWTPGPDYAGGYFSVTNRPSARLEAVAGKTTFVNIPMYRTEKTVATNKLQIAGGSMISVVWKANVTTQQYKYTIPTTAKAGTSIALKLYTADGKTVKSTSAINVVADPGNKISNPKWIGESFTVGEWTMDLDAALKKDGYTLAVVGGDMWCPYCQGLRDGVLSKTEFISWAKQNNVKLVCIDMPQKDKTTATLLTRDESAAGASGAAYLSRKMISDADAKTVFNRNKTLSGSTWLMKSTSATRLGNPTVLLLNSDKTVAGRLYTPNDGKVYPLAETLNRLDELLLLAGGSDEETDPARTQQTLEVEDYGDGSVQVNRNAVWYKLTNVPAGKVTFKGEGDRALTLSVYEYSGKGPCTNELATGTGSVTVTFKNGTNKYLKVAGFTDNKATYGHDTEFSFGLSSTVTLVPSAAEGSFTTRSGSVNLTVTAGKVYKLSGFSSYPGFTKNADGTYTATKGGTIAMKAPQGGKVTFQLWEPGTVQLASTSAKVMESDGKATFKVTRTGGSSGDTSFKLAVDAGSKGTKRVSVTPTTLTWAAGDATAKTVTCKITANKTFNPDEVFKVTLSKVSGSSALGSAKVFSLTVTDTDDPVLPADKYSLRFYKGLPAAQSYAVSNIKENGRVSFSTSGELPRGVRLGYDAATKKFSLSGKPTRAGTYKFSVKLSERRADGLATGTATAFTVTVADMADLKPGDEGYNAVFAAGDTVTGSVPVFGKKNGVNVLAGMVELQVRSNFRVKAKFTGVDSGKKSLSGYFTSIAKDGTSSVTLERSGVKAAVKLTSAGFATVTLTGLSTPFGTTLASESNGAKIVATEAERAAYAGYYAVSLPANESSLVKGGEVLSTGTGYVILKMTNSTFLRKGRVSYSGYLPNGKAFSGKAYICAGQVKKDGSDWGYLPIVVSKKTGSVGVLARIRRNAASTYKTDPSAVLAADGATPYWKSGSEILPLDVFGGYYERGMSLSSCCQEYYETTTFKLVCRTEWSAPSGQYGKIAATSTGSAKVEDSGRVVFSGGDEELKPTLKINRSTGVVTGSVYVKFAGGKKLRLKVRGVILPGWTDCGCLDEAPITRPFASLTATFNDRVGRSCVISGFAVELQ